MLCDIYARKRKHKSRWHSELNPISIIFHYRLQFEKCVSLRSQVYVFSVCWNVTFTLNEASIHFYYSIFHFAVLRCTRAESQRPIVSEQLRFIICISEAVALQETMCSDNSGKYCRNHSAPCNKAKTKIGNLVRHIR